MTEKHFMQEIPQRTQLVAPAVARYVPATQSSHPDAPAEAWYWPALQLKQATSPSPLNLPAAQIVQDAAADADQ
jgi:hypothetical protein